VDAAVRSARKLTVERLPNQFSNAAKRSCCCKVEDGARVEKKRTQRTAVAAVIAEAAGESRCARCMEIQNNGRTNPTERELNNPTGGGGGGNRKLPPSNHPEEAATWLVRSTMNHQRERRILGSNGVRFRFMPGTAAKVYAVRGRGSGGVRGALLFSAKQARR